MKKNEMVVSVLKKDKTGGGKKKKGQGNAVLYGRDVKSGEKSKLRVVNRSSPRGRKKK